MSCFILTWESLLIGLDHKLMQVAPNPGGGMGLPGQQPTRTKDGSIPGRLGLVPSCKANVMGSGCRLMGSGPLVSPQLKQPVRSKGLSGMSANSVGKDCVQ